MQRIALRTVNRPGDPTTESVLSYQEAMASPCETCASSPCCTHVPLRTFGLDTLSDLDYALYVLNFDRMEIGLKGNGVWEVYYRYPCRFIDRRDFSCQVHGTPRQPRVCVHYNPYQCSYKPFLTSNTHERYLRIDRRRMEFIRDHVTFDESRRILDVPSWQTMLAAFADMPVEPISQFADVAPVDDVWLTESAGTAVDVNRPSRGPHMFESETIQNPCGHCHAYCCTTLMFPGTAPTGAAQVDRFRFLLGFPGIELGISGQTWVIVVRTRCRHLNGNRCAVYGEPERPLRCRYYDALTCNYRGRFGIPRPDTFLRVTYEQFDWLAECLPFDAQGKVLAVPPMELIQEHFDERSRMRDQIIPDEDAVVRGS